MSDEDDDYMSDNFLKKAEDVQPGITNVRTHRRHLNIESNRFKMEEKHRQIPKKAELEKTRREEALSKPVCQSSKGFTLMSKMGYKPGMSLGKKKDENDLGSGIMEPIGIELKSNRSGLGHEVEEEKKSKDRLMAEIDRMRDRSKRSDELIEEYRKRKRQGSSTKQLVSDIIRSRKVCADLDIRIELEYPLEPWFWASYRQRNADATLNSNRADDDDDDSIYIYSNGNAGPKEERFDQLSDDLLEERLEEITAYLRAKHLYCIWCGCAFEDADFSSDCPGNTRIAHESGDD